MRKSNEPTSGSRGQCWNETHLFQVYLPRKVTNEQKQVLEHALLALLALLKHALLALLASRSKY